MRESCSRFHGVRAAGFFLLCVLLAGADMKPGDMVRQDAVSYRMEGRDLQAAGELQRASSAFRRAVALYPHYAEAYNDLGVVLESMGDLENAEAAYKSALVEDPELAAAHSNLALLYEEQGRTQAAANHWVARIRLGPPDDPWVLRARQRMSAHKIPMGDGPEEAAEKKKKAVKLAILQGQFHMDAREWDRAIREFERALELEPGSSKAARHLAAARLKVKEKERKIDREMELATRNVLKERELVEKDEAMKRREEARREADSKRRQELREKAVQREAESQRWKAEPVRRQAPAARTGKPWWKFWAADEGPVKQPAVRKPEPVPVPRPVRVLKVRPARPGKPWWKFWAADEESKKRSIESRREKELEKEVERARKIAEAKENALREAEGMMRASSLPAVRKGDRPAPALVREAAPPAPAPRPAPSRAEGPAPEASNPPPPPAPVKPALSRVEGPAEPAVSSAEALKMAQEYAKERSKSTARAEEDLYKRGIAAMREGSYQDAAEHFRQVLVLNPRSVDAKNALTRAEKAWEREQQEQGLGSL